MCTLSLFRVPQTRVCPANPYLLVVCTCPAHPTLAFELTAKASSSMVSAYRQVHTIEIAYLSLKPSFSYPFNPFPAVLWLVLGAWHTLHDTRPPQSCQAARQ
eukprot:GHUV01046807.1.p1 GENE.GHUV01046807.1~~GHUV01046807.1.p1  ORF type:complete len:102 (-),score=1.70 GHUV01046807.1:257-562(-)